MTTWHPEQERPANLIHSTKATVVVTKPGEHGYTMVYDTLIEAKEYAEWCDQRYARVFPPTGKAKS